MEADATNSTKEVQMRNGLQSNPIYNNFLVDVDSEDVVVDDAAGPGYQETGSSEEYIDDYYAACSLSTNMQSARRRFTNI